MSNKPDITRTAHVLPFDRLSPSDFERLCFWLIVREGFEEAEHLGTAGNEQGRDIVANENGQQLAFQCKRVKAFSSSDAINELNKVLSLPPADRPVGIVFLVTCIVSTTTRDRARVHARNASPNFTTRFWCLTELDERVKRHPEIVSEFFQLGAVIEPAEMRARQQDWAIDVPPTISDVGNFVGREDILSALHLAVKRDIVRIGIWGPPGIGKTRTVQHFFWQCKQQSDLYDPIWLRVDDLFGKSRTGADAPGVLKWSRHGLLERLEDEKRRRPRAVFVFDNVQANPADIAWIVTRLGQVPAFFLTWDAGALPPCNPTIRLAELPQSASRQLMLSYSGEHVDRNAVSQLCDILEHYPIQLELAGRRLRLQTSTIEDLIEECGTKGTLLLKGRTFDREEVHIAQLVWGSFNCLDPAERRVLCALAALPAHAISGATVRWTTDMLGGNQVHNLDRSLQLGLITQRAVPDWRGCRYQFRSLMRDVFHLAEEFESSSRIIETYLSSGAALKDPSVEVIRLALERRLATQADKFPFDLSQMEYLFIEAIPSIRACVRNVVERVDNIEQRNAFQKALQKLFRTPRSEVVTLEYLELLRRWGMPDKHGELRRLFIRPMCQEIGEAYRSLTPVVSGFAAKVLADLNNQSLSEFISEQILSDNWSSRKAAMRVATYEEVGAAREAIVKLLGERDSKIRKLAVDGLWWGAGDQQVADRVFDLFANDSDEHVTFAAACTLGVHRDQRVVEYLLSRLSADDSEIRAEVCSVLWRFCDVPAVAARLVELATTDVDIDVRINIVFALLDEKHERAGSLWFQLIEFAEITPWNEVGDRRDAVAGLGVTLRPRTPFVDSLPNAIANKLTNWLSMDKLRVRRCK
ncbi:MAG: HEAT repeat domain-containing protein [Verrucomicrobia bacterium]|nr:HEAT repeat domain-containing protein [Verrucomicrobiota bacterium]